MTLRGSTPADVRKGNVAALYIDPRGPYPKLLGSEFCWDEERDARKYAGPWPVIAHPPCGPWGYMRSLSRESREVKLLAPLALAAVYEYGGVLEHPQGSKLWDMYDLPRPGELPDKYGGRTFVVDQCDFGHPARKRTWLYCVRCLPGLSPLKRKPTHWCSGVHTPGARGKPPPGVRICSAQQRRRTPLEFAKWLVALASTAGRPCVTEAEEREGR